MPPEISFLVVLLALLAHPGSFYLLWLTRHVGTSPLTPCLISWPGGMREAIRRPGLPGVACWILLCCLFLLSVCLSWSFCPGFPGSGCSCPPPKVLPGGSHIPPGATTSYHLNALGAHFFRIFFSTSFFIDFFVVLASILAPKIDPKPEKI